MRTAWRFAVVVHRELAGQVEGLATLGFRSNRGVRAVVLTRGRLSRLATQPRPARRCS